MKPITHIVEWLKENKDNYSDRKDILNALNKNFNTNISMGKLATINYRYNLSLNAKKMSYTKEMFDWLKTNKFATRQQLCDEFNKKFDRNLTLGKLRDLNTKRKLNIGNPTRNMGNLEKGFIKIRGYISKNIGDEIERGEDVPYIKIGHNEYVPKNRFMYEKYHNVKLSNNDLIIFLDDDKTNYSIDNLYKISRNMIGIMVGNELTNINVMKKHEIIKFVEWKEKLTKLKEVVI